MTDKKDTKEKDTSKTCHWCDNPCIRETEAQQKVHERGGWYFCFDCCTKIDVSTAEAKKWFDWPTKTVNYSATPEMVLQELANQKPEHFKLSPRERAQVALWCAQAVDRHERKHIPNGGMGCWHLDPDFWTEGKGYVSIKEIGTVV